MLMMCLHRTRYGDNATIGELWLGNEDEGKWLCNTLEDKVRPEGEKVPGKTAIPVGLYKVVLTESARFKRVLPLVLNVPNFTGIRIHAGNTDKDTEGCILVGETYQNGFMLINSRKTLAKLMTKLEEADKTGEEIWLEVS